MLKSILRFLAASISFIALLFTTNPAIATTLDSSTQQISTPVVNLSVSSLSISSLDPNLIQNQNHLGCSCADCTASLAARK